MRTYKTTLLASIGAGLEYYDFIVFGFLSPYLSHLFFPPQHNLIQLMQTFFVLAWGYFIRPVGGLLFGIIGDRYGRKKSFFLLMILMAFAMLWISFLPTYSQIGLWAPVLLLIGRLLQGLSYGGDLACAVVFVFEHVHEKKRGLHCGLLMMSVSLGMSLASLINYLLNSIFTSSEIHEWAWRIPFWIGAGLALIAFQIRRQLNETPLFLKQAVHNTSILAVLFKNHYGKIIQGILLIVMPCCLVMLSLVLPSYLSTLYQFPFKSIYLAITLSSLWCAICIPFFASLSDRIGRKQLMLSISFLMIILSGLFLKIPETHKLTSLFVFLFVYETILAVLAACYFALLSEIFPTKIRLTGFAFCYNSVYALGGCIPFFISFLMHRGNVINLLTLFFILLGVISAANLFSLRRIRPAALIH